MKKEKDRVGSWRRKVRRKGRIVKYRMEKEVGEG